MSDLTKVWNDNIFPYTENFQGEDIHIPPNKFIEMDQDKATLFNGTFKQPLMINGVQDKKSYKMIRLEHASTKKTSKKDEKEKVFVCMACNKEYQTKAGLNKHSKESHIDIMADKEAKDKILKDKEDES